MDLGEHPGAIFSIATQTLTEEINQIGSCPKNVSGKVDFILPLSVGPECILGNPLISRLAQIVKWPFPDQRFIEGYGKAENVRLLITAEVLSKKHEVGGRVLQRTRNPVLCTATRNNHATDTQIHNLRALIFTKEYVAGFHVAVEDAFSYGICKGISAVAENTHGIF